MVIVSPGFAGRNGTPAIRPTLPTYVTPSWYKATRYCLPPILKLAGASTPGAKAAFWRLTLALVPAQLVTVTSFITVWTQRHLPPVAPAQAEIHHRRHPNRVSPRREDPASRHPYPAASHPVCPDLTPECFRP